MVGMVMVNCSSFLMATGCGTHLHPYQTQALLTPVNDKNV